MKSKSGCCVNDFEKYLSEFELGLTVELKIPTDFLSISNLQGKLTYLVTAR